MGHRYYRRRSSTYARRSMARHHRQYAIQEAGSIELIVLAVAASFRAVVRGARWLLRLPSQRQLPPPPPGAIPLSGWNDGSKVNRGSRGGSDDAPSLPTEDYDKAVARIAALLPYRGVRCVLTDGERAFWQPLCRAVGDRYLIFCKIRLADLAAAPDDRADSGRRFQDIGAFHVDFVLCDIHTTAPLLVIELDDRSHAALRARNRDRFKDAVLKAAGLPIYRVKCQPVYAPIELSEEIARRIPSRRTK